MSFRRDVVGGEREEGRGIESRSIVGLWCEEAVDVPTTVYVLGFAR